MFTLAFLMEIYASETKWMLIYISMYRTEVILLTFLMTLDC